MLTLVLLLGPPLLASGLSILVRPYKRIVGWVGVAGALVSLAASLALCADVVTGGPAGARHPAPDLWHVDALSALLALCVAFVALLASALGPGLGRNDGYPSTSLSSGASTPLRAGDAAQTRRFRIFTSAFAFTMLAAVTIQNVALMWVAVEATTIMSAMLIPLTRTKASVEASWKYLLICSVGTVGMPLFAGRAS